MRYHLWAENGFSRPINHLPILLSSLLCRTFCPSCIFLVLFLVGLVVYNFKKSLTRLLSRSFLPVVSPRFTISGSICKSFVHLQFNFWAENEIKIQYHSSQGGYLVSPIPLRDAVISSVWIFGTLVKESVNTWIWHYLLTMFVLLFCVSVLMTVPVIDNNLSHSLSPGRAIPDLFLWLLCLFMTLNAYIEL